MKSAKLAIIFQLIFMLGAALNSNAQSAYNSENFYDAMANENLQQVETQLKEAQAATGTSKEAFIGTLTMKKAGLISGAGKKLKTFKAGHAQLEAAIAGDKDNPEYRFMRLMIQEHAPGILGYKNEIQTDSDYIRKSFKNLSKTVQKAVVDYAQKRSKVLSAKDFN